MILTKLQIIEETVSYYSEDINRRGLTSGGVCVYCTEDDKQCAVGRVLINPKKFQKDVKGKVDTSIKRLVNGGIKLNSRLKKEYRGHDIEFWIALQNFHDDNDYWDYNGITKDGLEEVNRLKYKFSDKDKF